MPSKFDSGELKVEKKNTKYNSIMCHLNIQGTDEFALENVSVKSTTRRKK